MIKPFAPFQSKIHLRIETEFLQNLWDRYIPVSAKNYEQISLIYRKEAWIAETESRQKIQLLLRLILQNTFVQFSLKQNRIVYSSHAVSRQVAQATNYYFAQLKRMDFSVYRSFRQSIVYLEQIEKERQRYRAWEKENQAVRLLQKEYRSLCQLYRCLQELTAGERGEWKTYPGKTVFQSLEESEYKFLSETVLAIEKMQIREYLEHCSSQVCREIWYRLEKTALFRGIGKERLLWQQGEAEKVTVKQLVTFLDTLEPEVFQKCYQEILFSDRKETDKISAPSPHIPVSPGIVWKSTKKEMERYLEQQKEEALRSFWKNLPPVIETVCRAQEEGWEESRVLSFKIKNWFRYRTGRELKERLEQKQAQYLTEVRTRLEQEMRQANWPAPSLFADIPYRKNAEQKMQAAPLAEEEGTADRKEVPSVREAKQTDIFQKITEVRQEVRVKLRERKKELLRRERSVLERYQDLLPAEEWNAVFAQQESQKELAKNQKQKKLRDWSKALLQFKVLAETLDFGDVSGTDSVQDVSARNPLPRPEKGEEVLLHPEKNTGKNREEPVRTEQKSEDRELLLHFTEQIAEETGVEFTFLYRKEQMETPVVQELLQYIRQMNETAYSEFIRKLADALRLEQAAEKTVVSRLRREEEARDKEPGIREQEHGTVEEAAVEQREWEETLLRHALYRPEGAAEFSDSAGRTTRDRMHTVPDGENRSRTQDVFSERQAKTASIILQTSRVAAGQKSTGDVRRESAGAAGQKSMEDVEQESAGNTKQEFLEDARERQKRELRQQVETAKARSRLQQLLGQINHRIHREDLRLIYREEQLQEASIGRLLAGIGQMEEKEYRETVIRLADGIVRQWERQTQNRQAQNAQEQKQQVQRESSVSREKEVQSSFEKQESSRRFLHQIRRQTVHERYPVFVQRVTTYGERQREEQERKLLQLLNSAGVKKVKPQRRIPEETGRDLRGQENSGNRPGFTEAESSGKERPRSAEAESPGKERLGSAEAESPGGNRSGFTEAENLGRNRPGFTEAENPGRNHRELTGEKDGGYPKERQFPVLWNFSVEGMPPDGKERRKDLEAFPIQELTVAMREGKAGGRERQELLRRQEEEHVRIRSLQQQMETRLREVEQKIQTADVREDSEESARVLAEKVKKQLHEELHMERLRRGMQ